MTRAIITQIVEALEGLANTHQQGRSVAAEGAFGYVEMHVQNAEGAITAAREYLATEPKPTLKEALAQQVAVPQKCKQIHVTEAMHRAAVKVLHRAPGVAGLPQRMMDAMLAAQGEKP